MTGYWFSTTSKRLRFGDRRKAKVGITHAVGGELALYRNGLHACVTILDALDCAPSPVLWWVSLASPLQGEKIVQDGNNCVARSRTYLAGGVDISPVLESFARRVALDVVDLWDAPAVTKLFLHTGDETLRDAAWAAARDDTWAAARDDTWAATRDYVCYTKEATARSAAWFATWDYTQDAKEAAVRNAKKATWTAIKSVRYAEQYARYAWYAWYAEQAAKCASQDAAQRRYNMWLNKMVRQYWADGNVQKEW